MSQIDDKPGDRWKRKVGYEIERRLVKAIQVSFISSFLPYLLRFAIRQEPLVELDYDN